jgi:GNAT superfamily N-acetyltransferase
MRTGLGAAEATDSGERRLIVDTGGEIGFVEFGVRDDWLDVRWIELEAGRRGWGHGSEAVRLLEDEARGRGVSQVTVEVPAGSGLAMYFWLRLGYRPAGRENRKSKNEKRKAADRPDTMQMVRGLGG